MTQNGTEEDRRRFNAVVVGEESLLIQCAEMLREQGHTIAAVVSNATEIQAWADGAGLPIVANNAALAEGLTDYDFDYLFSITNLRIIPDSVTSQAAALSINFHDGPLPAYAGLYATSWALINGETTHGVSWHTIESGIDEGDLLKQVLFDIDEEETAYTLNVKCYEHAMSSFAELIEELSSGSEQRQHQDLSNRSYFGKFLRPSGAATIDWAQPVAAISSLVRALNFGSHQNPLGRAKLFVDGEVFILDSVKTSLGDPGAEPGTIVALDEDSVQVAAHDGTVELDVVTDAKRSVRSSSSVLAAAGLGIGDRLPDLSSDRRDRLTQLVSDAGRAEPHWVGELENLQSVDLPYVDPAASSDGTGLATLDLALPPMVAEYLRAQEQPAEFIIGAFAAYLRKLTGAESFTLSLGHPLDGSDADLQPWFAASVPLSCSVPTDEPASTAISAIARSIEDIREKPAFACDTGSRHPELVSRESSWADRPLSVAVDVVPEMTDVDHGEIPPRADLSLSVSESADHCRFTYVTGVYPAGSMNRIEVQFLAFLEQVVSDDSRSINEVSLLTPADHQQIVVDWNATFKDVDLTTGLHQLFMQKAGELGEATALVHQDRRMTYAELDARSNQLAHRLKSLGAGPGSNVGVFMERGLDMVVGLLGVLKSGAAYIPLDPTYPLDRVHFMIEDSGIAVLLSQSVVVDQVTDYDGEVVRIDGDWEEIATYSDQPPETASSSDDLAYLIYTSGSTGKPKGVMVTHANAINFLAGMDDHIEHSSGDTWLTVTSLSFDISVLEIFWTLTRGLELVIYSDEITNNDPDVSPPSADVDRDINFSLFYFASDESEAGDGQKYELLMEGARFADQHGFEAVWTPERHFYAFGGLYPNPAVTSAAIAAITENVHIRAGSCVLPLHHPVRVAEEWAVVDNISKGRVGIAFAAGWQPVDFVLRPENFADRKAAVERDIAIVQRLWQGETITMEGPTGPAEIRTLPRPIQPTLPSWLTVAGNPDTFAAAGAGGFNVLTHLLGQSLDEVEEKIKIYRKARAAAGHEGDGQVTLMLHTFVGEDVEQVRDLVRGPMVEYLRSSVSLIKEAAWSFPTFQQKSEATGKSPMELFDDEDLTDEEMNALLEHAFNRYFEGSALFGTPSTCKAMVNDLKRIGVDEIACQVDFGLSAEEVLKRLPALNELRQEAQKPVAPVEDFSIPALIKRHDVSHFQCTPSMGSMLVADDQLPRGSIESQGLPDGRRGLSSSVGQGDHRHSRGRHCPQRVRPDRDNHLVIGVPSGERRSSGIDRPTTGKSADVYRRRQPPTLPRRCTRRASDRRRRRHQRLSESTGTHRREVRT